MSSSSRYILFGVLGEDRSNQYKQPQDNISNNLDIYPYWEDVRDKRTLSTRHRPQLTNFVPFIFGVSQVTFNTASVFVWWRDMNSWHCGLKIASTLLGNSRGKLVGLYRASASLDPPLCLPSIRGDRTRKTGWVRKSFW